MRNKSFTLLAIAIVALLVGAVGVYAYDSSKKETVAPGVTVGGVDIGGLTATEARAKVRSEVAEPLQQPVVVRHRGKRFTLGPDESRVRPDVNRMVGEAIEESRSGNVISRTFRGVTGGEVDKEIEVDVKYSKPAVIKLVKRVKAGVDRPAKDASVSFDGGEIAKVPGQTGRVVKVGQLQEAVETALVRPGSAAVVARTKVTKPKVTADQLEDKYPTFLRVDRTNFQLHLYKRLKLKKSYTVAVGAAGFDTPAGVYHIQNKGENVPWTVPDKPWAGDLAGTVVPGGTPQNPLKARWMGIFDGAGIHGTDQTGSLGSRASHGCVRMAIPDVIELYPQVEVGAPIYIG